jgi:ABC-type nickel/cobalt efflux system permease component RcnA
MNEAAMANMETFGFIVIGVWFFLACAVLYGVFKVLTTPTGKAIIAGIFQTILWMLFAGFVLSFIF